MLRENSANPRSRGEKCGGAPENAAFFRTGMALRNDGKRENRNFFFVKKSQKVWRFKIYSYLCNPKRKARVKCGNSSVGRAQPCQGWGREFESRFPLHIYKLYLYMVALLLKVGFFVLWKSSLHATLWQGCAGSRVKPDHMQLPA